MIEVKDLDVKEFELFYIKKLFYFFYSTFSNWKR